MIRAKPSKQQMIQQSPCSEYSIHERGSGGMTGIQGLHIQVWRKTGSRRDEEEEKQSEPRKQRQAGLGVWVGDPQCIGWKSPMAPLEVLTNTSSMHQN